MEKPTFNIEFDKDIFILEPIGEVDASSSPELLKVIEKEMENGYSKILVDCVQLRYLSSAGIGVFISKIEDLREQNGSFAFCNLNENIYDSFKALGFLSLLIVTDTREEAKANLNEGEFYSSL